MDTVCRSAFSLPPPSFLSPVSRQTTYIGGFLSKCLWPFPGSLKFLLTGWISSLDIYRTGQTQEHTSFQRASQRCSSWHYWAPLGSEGHLRLCPLGPGTPLRQLHLRQGSLRASLQEPVSTLGEYILPVPPWTWQAVPALDGAIGHRPAAPCVCLCRATLGR